MEIIYKETWSPQLTSQNNSRSILVARLLLHTFQHVEATSNPGPSHAHRYKDNWHGWQQQTLEELYQMAKIIE